MGITRFRNSKQLGLSPDPASVAVSDSAGEASWLSPLTGENSTLYYKNATQSWTPLSFSSNFIFNGDELDINAGGGGFYTEIQEEGTTVGSGNTKINFVGAAYTAADAGSGVTTITADPTLNALAQFNSNGFLVQTSADNFAARTITAASTNIVITNGSGVGANPTVDVGANVALLDANNVFTGSNTFNQVVTASAAPTLADHLVNKSYVDGLLAGVRRSSVRVASTANIDVTSALTNGSTIDTVVVATGDRVLLKNQTDPAENGIWIVVVSGAASRASDMNAANEVDGTMVLVEDGSQAGSLWYTVSEVTTLGTDPITFTQIDVGGIDTDGSGSANLVTFWIDSDTVAGHVNFNYSTDQLTVGHFSPLVDAVINTKGASADDAKWGYAHSDSTATVVFTVSNTGKLTIGKTNPMSITNSLISRATGGIDIQPAVGSSISLKVSGNTTNASNVVIGTGDITNTTATISLVDIPASTRFNPSSGSGVFNAMRLAFVVNQTGGSSGIARGIHITPDLSGTVVDFRGLEITTHASHYALWTTLGKVRFDLGGDDDYDMLYRDSFGNLQPIPNGQTGQVLISTTNGAPQWGAVPVGGAVDEGYITGATTNTFDLDVSGTAKDVDGGNIVFTIPSNLKLFHVYLNGQKLVRTGTGPVRDYTANSTTHVLTLTNALVASDVLYIYKHG